MSSPPNARPATPGWRCTRSAPKKYFGRKTTVKILYFTQLLGMALGLSARKVGVHENFSESAAFLHARGLG